MVGPGGSGQRVVQASALGASTSTAAPAAPPAEGPLEALQYALEVSTLVHQSAFDLLLRLESPGGKGRESGADGAGPGAGGSKDSGGGSDSDGNSAGCDESGHVQASLRSLLQEALAESALYEHLARGLLHLLNAGRKLEPTQLFTAFLRSYSTALCLGAFVTRVLDGPCATYLATVAGLQLLCTADVRHAEHAEGCGCAGPMAGRRRR